MNNPVTSPAHYLSGKHEVIVLTRELDFCAGNALKYALRAPAKGNARQDYEKCAQYLEWMDAERHPGFLSPEWITAAQDTIHEQPTLLTTDLVAGILNTRRYGGPAFLILARNTVDLLIAETPEPVASVSAEDDWITIGRSLALREVEREADRLFPLNKHDRLRVQWIVDKVREQ